MQNYFSVKCYTEWTNSCSGNAEKNDVKYSRKFEHAAPINTWTNFANRMYDSAELWTGKLSPRLESNYSGNKCSNDLTIMQEKLIPWQCEIKLQDICACLYVPFFTSRNSHVSPVWLSDVLWDSGLLDLQKTVKIQGFAQEIALSWVFDTDGGTSSPQKVFWRCCRVQ